MKLLHPGAAAMLIVVGLLITGLRTGFHSGGVLDTAVFLVFLAVLWYCLSDFSARGDPSEAEGHEQPRKGFPFLFGQSLGRIFRRFRGGS